MTTIAVWKRRALRAEEELARMKIEYAQCHDRIVTFMREACVRKVALDEIKESIAACKEWLK